MAGDRDKQQGGDEEVTGDSGRRSSPRLAIRRLVYIACKNWKKYREVYSKNIGRRSLMVIVSDDPPTRGSTAGVWMGVDEIDMPREWRRAVVVRIHEDAGGKGEHGVVVRLADPEAEAMWCLVARGDEGEVPLPRGLPDFFDPEKVAAAAAKKKKRKRGKGGEPDTVSLVHVHDELSADGQARDVDALKERLSGLVETQRSSDAGPSPLPAPKPSSDGPGPPPIPADARGSSPLAKEQAKAKAREEKGGGRNRDGFRTQPLKTDIIERAIREKRKKEKAAKAPPEPTPVPASSPAVRQIAAKPSKELARARARKTGVVPVVGLDFGTTYSKIAVFDGDEVTLIEDTTSTSSTRASVPSVVAYMPDGTVRVGEAAQELLAVDPSLVISSVKRVMGLKYSDPMANGFLASLACPTSQGPNDSILFEMHGKLITVPEVVSRILSHMGRIATDWVGAEVSKAVFTVPVDFDIEARRELELAARMAGIEVKAMVPEPVSAAMGCGYDGSGKAVLAIFDFGGGTFDASVVEVGHDRFVVRGAAGDRWLGGDDFDELTARYVAGEFLQQSGVTLRNRLEEWQRLLFACEEAKRWLSTLKTVDVVLPEAANTPEGPLTLLVPVSRQIFEDIGRDVVAASLDVCNKAAEQAGIVTTEVDSLLITGGTTRIPAVREAAQELFQKTPAVGVHPQHAVVIGAAVRAAVLSGAPVPKDYAERLRGQGVVGTTIGLALADGTTEHIIDHTDTPPTAAHRLYSTFRDGQTTIRIEIVQGPSKNTEENQPVGGFVVDGLPAEKAGAISLDVYFELSSTGTFNVTAQERSTGQRAQGIFELTLGE